MRFVDNALSLDFEAPDRSSALDVGLEIVDRFLQRLALEHGRRFSARPLFLEDELQNLVPLPVALFRRTVTVFDLEALKGQVESAVATLEAQDEALQKALDYYEHALFLSSAASEPDGLKASLRTASHLQAAAFLFLWKALSVIVGDPSIDSDYQRRYRRLGLDYEFFSGTIEEIRRFRNDEDVAHYRLDNNGLAAIRERFTASIVAVRTVIRAYIATQSNAAKNV